MVARYHSREVRVRKLNWGCGGFGSDAVIVAFVGYQKQITM